MADLVSRLLEAITAAEKDARDAANTAAGAQWRSVPCPSQQCEGHLVTPAEEGKRHPNGFIECYPHEGGGMDAPVGPHIAHNDPSSVLRRCAADRRVVEHHRNYDFPFVGDEGGVSEYSTEAYCDHCHCLWPCPDLRDRAEAYGLEVTE